MGFFDKIKKFAGGAKTASVEVLEVNGATPSEASLSVSDTQVTGSMRVTIQEDCTMLATKYAVVLKTIGEDGEWSGVTIAESKFENTQEHKVGDSYELSWTIDEVNLPEYLGYQGWTDANTAVGDEKVKIVIRCTADVKGSPFDPEGEAEVTLTEGSPVGIRISVIEGMPADASSFPVTDSVLKGTVEVSAIMDSVLTATKYEIRLRLEDGSDVLVAQDQDPELNPNPMSVSFGGTNIKFPLSMKSGKRAEQTWMVSDIDLPGALAKHGLSDANEAVAEGKASLFVRAYADIEGLPNAAQFDTPVQLTVA